MTERRLKIGLLSDLHAFKPENGKPSISHLPANPVGSNPDPFGDLENIIASDPSLKCDLLICPGDICDRADYHGFDYAWKRLNALKARLEAKALIATCGNHDLDSRITFDPDDPDPKGALQTITPQFPFDDDGDTNHYWAKNFVVLTPLDGVRVVVLNTSAFHGSKTDEQQHGRVSRRTIEAIVKKLKDDPHSYRINLLVCHHHLRPLRGYGTTTDTEFVKKGGELLEAICPLTDLPWIVLHGHRHQHNIEFSTSPGYLIVGASSFSMPNSGYLNQYHSLEICVDSGSSYPLAGTISTLSWATGQGWHQRRAHPGTDEGFPPLCGFGYSGSMENLCIQIETSIGDTYKFWNELAQDISGLRFLTPISQDKLLRELGKRRISVQFDSNGNFGQVGKNK
ncbi:metallophosphoesterase [Paucibacter sp. B2R-40]|uniref:metallophosphoesterase family protein n=1 Tax=Paucibacter sp. B2R-40 TaxID=2893554 RepID=UPI0021E3E219|nr:metallophosphoesterase [Paucibacter sp. B2R-40]MCV2356614.1 metallophosphoesterase [Paucibacter sp. B2R-40]